MSLIRFLADQNLNDDIITGLLRQDDRIEFSRAREIGFAEAEESELLARAAEANLILISHDMRTMPSHAYTRLKQGLPMPGLFIVKQTDPVGPVINDLLLIWSASEIEEWDGRVIYLPL